MVLGGSLVRIYVHTHKHIYIYIRSPVYGMIKKDASPPLARVHGLTSFLTASRRWWRKKCVFSILGSSAGRSGREAISWVFVCGLWLVGQVSAGDDDDMDGHGSPL